MTRQIMPALVVVGNDNPYKACGLAYRSALFCTAKGENGVCAISPTRAEAWGPPGKFLAARLLAGAGCPRPRPEWPVWLRWWVLRGFPVVPLFCRAPGELL